VRRGSLAAGAAAVAAGAVVVARAPWTRRGGGELVEIRYDDGSAVTLDVPSPARDKLLAPSRQAVAALRE
jgi:hypothetical protein